MIFGIRQDGTQEDPKTAQEGPNMAQDGLRIDRERDGAQASARVGRGGVQQEVRQRVLPEGAAGGWLIIM